MLGWPTSPAAFQGRLICRLSIGPKGEFDFTLQPDDYRSPDGDVKLADRLRSSVEGLGFRFVDEKVKVDYVTIDHAEPPDAN